MPIALIGTGVSRGIAIGKARLLRLDPVEVTEYVLPTALVDDEITRFRRALETTRRQLRAIRDRIPRDAPPDIAAFIDTHLLILRDSTLTRGPEETIRKRRCNAEWALKLEQDALVSVFEAMDDAYLKTRRDDIEHVIRRIQRALLDDSSSPEPALERGDTDRIVLADDLSPGDILVARQQKVAAVVTERGAPMSHTAILARSLGVPAIVGMQRAYQYVLEEETVIVDGAAGVLLADLDEDTLAYYRDRRKEQGSATARLKSLKDKRAVTRDRVEVTLRANIERPEDLDTYQQVGASGIGLYRTEFLYLNRRSPPDEEEQYRVYREVVEHLHGSPLTLRTLDLGADKLASGQTAGANPALGLRAVRYCLREMALFRTQLRAALRASAHGPLRLLIPMLSSLSELMQVQRLLEEARRELDAERRDYDPHTPLGVMVEVPAVALCAGRLAREVDFFSIGTNDLIQYALATDRADDQVNYLFDPLHPGVLKLIRLTLEAAAGAELPVAMCGEMAADARFTRLLLGMGLTEFSTPPSALLEVKRVIMDSDTAHLRRCVDALLAHDDPFAIADGVERLNGE